MENKKTKVYKLNENLVFTLEKGFDDELSNEMISTKQGIIFTRNTQIFTFSDPKKVHICGGDSCFPPKESSFLDNID